MLESTSPDLRVADVSDLLNFGSLQSAYLIYCRETQPLNYSASYTLNKFCKEVFMHLWTSTAQENSWESSAQSPIEEQAIVYWPHGWSHGFYVPVKVAGVEYELSLYLTAEGLHCDPIVASWVTIYSKGEKRTEVKATININPLGEFEPSVIIEKLTTELLSETTY